MGSYRGPFKKIIVGCDGTWLNSEYGGERKSYLFNSISGHAKPVAPSNVTRICRGLQPVSATSYYSKSGSISSSATAASGNMQIVCYHPGIGSAQNFWDRYINGATAHSITQNIREAYVAIQEQWRPGDEIFLACLNKKGMERWYEVFEDWEGQLDQGRVNLLNGYEGLRFGVQSGDDTGYAAKLLKEGLTTLNVPIKAVACYDTVGALGIPRLHISTPIIGPPLNALLGLLDKPRRRLAFIDTAVLPNVENCFHALALDETRSPYSPTLWEMPDALKHSGVNLKQVWFPGAHSSVGGSTSDPSLPSIPLAWMTAQLQSCGLEFDTEYTAFCRGVTRDYFVPPEFERGWAEGYMYDSVQWFYRLFGVEPRTPGRYRAIIDARTGMVKDRLLQNTHETVHPSARVRAKRGGLGVADVKEYVPRALEGWDVVGKRGNEAVDDPLASGFVWRGNGDSQGLELREEALLGEELVLLDTYEEIRGASR